MREFLNIDCMDAEKGMPSYPDKHFDLAIVDPPYGINITNKLTGTSIIKYIKYGYKNHIRKNWDQYKPDEEYFKLLKNISKNQIIFGANYFIKFLNITKGWIVWDKLCGFSSVNPELIYTSFDRSIQIFKRPHGLDKGFLNKYGGHIHPTQKPIALYRWLLENYARPGDLILDTHVGSASSLIACESLGFDYVGFEIDADYYRAAQKRIKEWRSMPLFDTVKNPQSEIPNPKLEF